MLKHDIHLVSKPPVSVRRHGSLAKFQKKFCIHPNKVSGPRTPKTIIFHQHVCVLLVGQRLVEIDSIIQSNPWELMLASGSTCHLLR